MTNPADDPFIKWQTDDPDGANSKIIGVANSITATDWALQQYEKSIVPKEDQPWGSRLEPPEVYSDWATKCVDAADKQLSQARGIVEETRASRMKDNPDEPYLAESVGSGSISPTDLKWLLIAIAVVIAVLMIGRWREPPLESPPPSSPPASIESTGQPP